MRTRAAIIREPGKPWEVTELELDEPRAGEVRIKFMASGMCHSDEHLRTGDSTGRLPMVGGHEGAGVIEAVGPDVTRVKAGDHVVCSFIPACGICRYCSTGHQNLCDWGAQMMTGMLADGTFRFHDDDGADLGGFCMLGTFSERAVVSQNSCVPDREGHPVRGGGADRLRRADRLGHRGLRGRRPGRADRGDLRRGRRRAPTPSRALATPAPRTSS